MLCECCAFTRVREGGAIGGAADGSEVGEVVDELPGHGDIILSNLTRYALLSTV
jgi:hypothetical protein